MQHPRTGTVFPGPGWGREEQTEYVHGPSIIGTRVSYSLGFPASEDNYVSCV